MSARKTTKIFGYRHHVRLSAVTIVMLFLSVCATQVFVAALVDTTGFLQRGITQDEQSVRITAAVPDTEETVEIFGADLYSDDIQPVWLEVENRRNSPIRVIHSSIDDNYYSPLEVSWLYQKQFRKSSRHTYDSWFVENAMPRYLAPGETRSGFVFTHVTKGTKGFNLDVYGEMSVAKTALVVRPSGSAESDRPGGIRESRFRTLMIKEKTC